MMSSLAHMAYQPIKGLSQSGISIQRALAGIERVFEYFDAKQSIADAHDAVYREGRVILDKRLRRAVKKKTQTGRGVQYS